MADLAVAPPAPGSEAGGWPDRVRLPSVDDALSRRKPSCEFLREKACDTDRVMRLAKVSVAVSGRASIRHAGGAIDCGRPRRCSCCCSACCCCPLDCRPPSCRRSAEFLSSSSASTLRCVASKGDCALPTSTMAKSGQAWTLLKKLAVPDALDGIT